ncbi:membrane dipeptidase [bacterium]|nr:membrane dipeptidase [bacterium]
MSLLKEKLPIVDMHEDLAWSMISYRRPFASSAASYMLTESSWRRSGLVWAWCSIFTLPEQRNETFFSRFIEAQFEIYNSLLAHYSGWLVPIGQKSDMSLLGEFGGQVGLSIMMEGAEPVQEPFQLESFFTRGVRSFSMTWHESNKYAGGNNGEGGLTDAGRLLINEAARLGMVLDVSHLNKESFWDVIEYRKLHCQNLCLIASHANAAAVCECARNLDDDQLSALREADASVGIVLLNSYLVPGWIDTEYHLKKPLPQETIFSSRATPAFIAAQLVESLHTGPKLEDENPDAEKPEAVDCEIVLEHIDHLTYMLGEDSVGIGSDFDGGLTKHNTPEPIRDLTDLQIIAELISERRNPRLAAKIMSENLLAFWRQALPE